jgi:very-short-patch-repair endonuclease
MPEHAKRRNLAASPQTLDVVPVERGQGRKYSAKAVVLDVVQAGFTGDMAMARLAERQHGVVSRAQLLLIGLGQPAIDHRVAKGRLHRVHRGVYRVGHTAPVPLAREMAAVLACGDHAVVSHRSSAFVYRLAPEDERAVDVTLRDGGRRRRPGIRMHWSRLQDADVTVCRGLPITTPERTLIDLSGSVRLPVLERAVEDARRRRLVTSNSLEAALDRAGRTNGVGPLRALLRDERGPAFTRSEAEARLAELVRKAGLPAAEHNVRVGGHEVDLLWRETRLVVEVDGYAYHSGRAAFERDRARDAQLQATGFRVMRVTWRQLADEPERVIAQLAQALAPGANALAL